jgi:hypothetical protein
MGNRYQLAGNSQFAPVPHGRIGSDVIGICCPWSDDLGRSAIVSSCRKMLVRLDCMLLF